VSTGGTGKGACFTGGTGKGACFTGAFIFVPGFTCACIGACLTGAGGNAGIAPIFIPLKSGKSGKLNPPKFIRKLLENVVAAQLG
jgi:hypothetical protein